MDRTATGPAQARLQVAQVVTATEAEGPGRRFAIWLQGCPLRCPGCCNPEMLPFAGGWATTAAELTAAVQRAAREEAVEGISLLGGEPLAQAAAAAALARGVREFGMSVMVFSGYTLEEIQAAPDPDGRALLALTDVLVDGPYVRERPEAQRRWVGSTNQRAHLLTDRYRADDPCWRLPNTLEVRLAAGELTVNGFPAASAIGLWRRPRGRS